MKCFDFINRNLLWLVLLKNGIRVKLLPGVKSIQMSVKARVRSGANLTVYSVLIWGEIEKINLYAVLFFLLCL